MEPFTQEAVTILADAMGHARRLGHRYIGGEHLLLALVSAGQPAAAVLRAHGLAPQRVEEEIIRHGRLEAGADLFGGLDRDALAAIGIDLDTVRARIGSSFEPEALAQAVQRGPRPSGLSPRHFRRDVSARLMRRWHRHRAEGMAPVPLRAAAGLWQRHGGTAVFLPFAPSARETLQNIRHEAQAQHHARPGVEHLALALIAMNDGLVPPILSALGVSAPAMRTAILDRYRQAS